MKQVDKWDIINHHCADEQRMNTEAINWLLKATKNSLQEQPQTNDEDYDNF